MSVREWALVAFTILAQMSVGAFVVLGLVHTWVMQRYSTDKADQISDRALLAIGPTLVLGLMASLFHLGNPLFAYRAVFNVGSSWLSREIALGSTFALLGALFAFLQWRKLGSFELRNAVALLAATVGLVLVYAMARVYMLPTQPAWNTWATPVSFFVTTFLLGTLAIGAAFVATYWLERQGGRMQGSALAEVLRPVLRALALAGIVLLGLEFVVAPLNVAMMATGGAAASVAMLTSQYGGMFALRLALVFLGAGVFGVWLYRTALRPGAETLLGRLAWTAFALVFVSEVLGRFLFYATHVKIGL